MSSETNNDIISIGEISIPFYEDNLIVQLGEDTVPPKGGAVKLSEI